MRQTERRTAQNRARRSAVRTYVKKAAIAVADTSDDAGEVVRQAVKALDKAAKRGIIHPNAAARRKSRLMSQLYALSVAPSGGNGTEAEATPGRGRAGSAAGTAAKKSTTARKPATKGAARGTTARRSSSPAKKDT